MTTITVRCDSTHAFCDARHVAEEAEGVLGTYTFLTRLHESKQSSRCEASGISILGRFSNAPSNTSLSEFRNNRRLPMLDAVLLSLDAGIAYAERFQAEGLREKNAQQSNGPVCDVPGRGFARGVRSFGERRVQHLGLSVGEEDHPRRRRRLGLF